MEENGRLYVSAGVGVDFNANPSRQKEIPESLEEQSVLLDELEKLIEALAVDMVPVMCDAPPSPPKDKTVRSYSTGVAKNINDNTRRIEVLAAHLASLRERLEV